MISTKIATLSPDRELTPVPPEHRDVVLTNRTRRSVWRSVVWYVDGRKPAVPGYCSIGFMPTKWTVHVSVEFMRRSCRCHGVPLLLRHVSSHCCTFGAAYNKAPGNCRIIGVAEDLNLSSFTPWLVYGSVCKIAKIDFASCIAPSAWNNFALTGRIFRKFVKVQFLL
jgi:hypothetical protein